MKHDVRVHVMDEARARRRVPLPVEASFSVEGPPIVDGVGDVDTLRYMVRTEIERRFPNRTLCGLSFVVGGGLTAVISAPGGNP